MLFLINPFIGGGKRNNSLLRNMPRKLPLLQPIPCEIMCSHKTKQSGTCILKPLLLFSFIIEVNGILTPTNAGKAMGLALLLHGAVHLCEVGFSLSCTSTRVTSPPIYSSVRLYMPK